MNFSQKDNKTFYQCWERFKDLLNTCPHHGYETWRIISFFYESLTPKMHQFVEMMCNGEFLNKDLDEAFAAHQAHRPLAHTLCSKWSEYRISPILAPMLSHQPCC